VIDFFEQFMLARWDELRFLTFAENEAVLSTVIDLAVIL